MDGDQTVAVVKNGLVEYWNILATRGVDINTGKITGVFILNYSMKRS
ncbi:MAG: hypothetical protein ACE5GL_11955 [Calditrichia bacterium]